MYRDVSGNEVRVRIREVISCFDVPSPVFGCRALLCRSGTLKHILRLVAASFCGDKTKRKISKYANM